MSKTSIILSVLMAVALVIFMAPGIIAINRGRALRNIALWLVIFIGLALIYQNFGPGSPHPLFTYGLSGIIKPDDGGAPHDKADDDKPDGSQGFTPPRE